MKLEKAIQTAENCRYCLMCRHIAPLEYITHLETHSPHGIALLIAAVERGQLQWNQEIIDVLYSDPDGGNSRAHCVTDQPLPDAIALIRGEIVKKNLAPKVVYELDNSFRTWKTPFKDKEPEDNSGIGKDALFVGDEAQYLWPDTVPYAIKMLDACSVDPILIGAGHNSGFLASSLGLIETARELANYILKVLADGGVERLFVLSPGDYFTFTKVFPERLDIAWPTSLQVIEVIQFLDEQYNAGNIQFQTKDEIDPYAYVDPTHAVRVPERHHAPRNLLHAVMNGQSKELFWRCERAHPVGSTALQFTNPELAHQFTCYRFKDAQNSGAQLLICEDPGTLSKLQEVSKSSGIRLKGMYELLAEQLA